MVSTRRSSHNEEAGASGSQPEVASAAPTKQHQHPGAAAAPAADQGLPAIAEEAPAEAEAAAPAAAADQQEEEQSQQPQQPAALAKRQRRQQPLSPQAGAAAPAAATAHSPADSGAGVDSSDDDVAVDDDAVGGSDDGADSGSDWDFEGPNMLQNLAASIRSAMGSRAGHQQQQQQSHGRRSKHKPPAPAAAAAAEAGGGEDMDIDRLRWQPHTGLQLPAKAVSVVAAAAAGARQGGGDAAAAAAGPLVDAPPEADSDAAAAAVGGAGSLAKHSRAPTLDPVVAAKAARAAAPKTAGKQWYGLPAAKITDEVKRDLRLLRLRGAYDPKRFYRTFDETKFPKHFAIGTVVDDPLDYYGGRLAAGQRKATLAEQLLADRELEGSRKKRYGKLQEEAQKWVKHKKRKTDLPRKTPSKHRPKH